MDFAKILIGSNGTNACGLDRDVYHREIEKRAAAIRTPAMSREQAYARVLETPEGTLLYKAYKTAPVASPPKQAPQDYEDGRPEAAGPASRELNDLASKMAKDKGISFQRAYYRVIADLSAFPDRRELLERAKFEEQAATREVRDSRWPIRAAEAAFERDWRLGRSAGSPRN
jgi:hypothetical protein